MIQSQSTLAHAHYGPAVIDNFVWQADGRGFYAMLDQQTLWYYDLATAMK